MAATTEKRQDGPLKIHLIHGSKNHFITLSPAEGSDITIKQLAEAAQNILGIPPDKQKLIYKGKTLNSRPNSPHTPLRSLGLNDGAKVMLLGSKLESDNPSPPAVGSSHVPTIHSSNCSHPVGHPSRPVAQVVRPPAVSDDLYKLSEIEHRLAAQSSTVQDAVGQLTVLRSQTNDPKAHEPLQKQLKLLSEGFMRLLESLDMLRFDSEDVNAKAKRKAMVDQIHALMDRCEEMVSSKHKDNSPA